MSENQRTLIGRGQTLEARELMFSQEPFIVNGPFKDLLIISRPSFGDDRGSFQENYRLPDIEQKIDRKVDIQQASISHSKKGVLRGIHMEPQDKIITPITGQVACVLVDLRSDSETFGEWVMYKFDNNDPDARRVSIFIPEGVGNSLCVYGDSDVLYSYQVTKTYDPKTAGMGINVDDPDLKIAWPVGKEERIIRADRDGILPTLREMFPQNFS